MGRGRREEGRKRGKGGERGKRRERVRKERGERRETEKENIPPTQARTFVGSSGVVVQPILECS